MPQINNRCIWESGSAKVRLWILSSLSFHVLPSSFFPDISLFCLSLQVLPSSLSLSRSSTCFPFSLPCPCSSQDSIQAAKECFLLPALFSTVDSWFLSPGIFLSAPVFPVSLPLSSPADGFPARLSGCGAEKRGVGHPGALGCPLPSQINQYPLDSGKP